MQKHGLHECVGDTGRVFRHRDDDTGFLLDALHLVLDDFDDGAVNDRVLAEHHHRPDFRRLLAEAVDAPVALLVAGGIPVKVVVDHCVEQPLQVNTL
ncbi:hypothetical protein D9M70_538220 [compost metagenome]